MRVFRTLRAAALVAAAVSMSPRTSAAPSAGAPVEVARLTCTALVQAGSLTCAPTGDGLGGAALTIGSVRADGGTWMADVAVQNLSAATLGAPDAGVPGVSVEVVGQPVTTLGSGTVAAPSAWRSADAVAPGAASAAQAWAFGVPEGVEAFTFTAAVMATVSYPRGRFAFSPTSLITTAGGTAALSASARTRTGVALPPGFVQFSSSNTAVATVAQNGTVTGVAPGLATVTATAVGTGGTATVCVDPGLAVGGVYHFTLTSGQALCLQGGPSGNAEYTIMPQNQTGSQQIVSLTGSGIVGVTGPPTPFTEDGQEGVMETRPTRLSLDGTFVVDEEAPNVGAVDAAEFARIERENAETAPLFQQAGARITAANRAAATGGGASHLIPPGVPTVGALWNLNVATGCSGAVTNRVSRVVGLSAHFIAVEDTLNPYRMPQVNSGNYYTADSILAQAERIVWPTVTNAFGQPTDLDTNERVVLYFTRAVNELAPPAAAGYTAGYYAGRDLFSSAPASCPRSNEGEIMYLLVPDPAGVVNSNIRTLSQVIGGLNRTIGHELARLINGSRRLYVEGATGFEEPWLEMGLANIADELMFYRTAVGLTPGMNIQLSNLTTGPNASRRVAAFNAYANFNYARWRSFLQRPDTSGVYTGNGVQYLTGTQAGASGQGGSTWSFLRYAADRRGGDQNAFWTSLISSRSGLDNLRNALGLATEADVLTWVRDWTVANYADDNGVFAPSAVHQHLSWNYRSVYGGLGGFPLFARPLIDDTALTLQYRRRGGTTYMRAGVPTGTFATFTTGSTFSSPLLFSVVRTK